MLLDLLSGHFFPGEIVFLLLCFAGAWMVGKSIATDWKPIASLFFAVLLLGVGARFLHFALYEAQFVSVPRYLIDTAAMLVIAYLGFRFTRTNQMTTQYHWMYEKTSPFSWKDRS